jgi:uncharacterized glyoxalase superfamily metalloenzyme YdcJ
VSRADYQRLHDAHRLIADVVCFKGPHINHLTPRTLDIDAAQAEMPRRGIVAKEVVEGPPRRRVPILLRQTSFKALEETVTFAGDRRAQGAHTARFGEIEQRGIALTRAGRALYDALLERARNGDGAGHADDGYPARLARVFEAFPDDLATLRRDGLGFFRYALRAGADLQAAAGQDLDALVEQGIVEATPITYEDFLPVSAAGIFQSNLADGGLPCHSATATQGNSKQHSAPRSSTRSRCTKPSRPRRSSARCGSSAVGRWLSERRPAFAWPVRRPGSGRRRLRCFDHGPVGRHPDGAAQAALLQPRHRTAAAGPA